jgi:lipopolysaccharide export system protein LptA
MAATAAALIALFVAVVYVQRTVRSGRARRALPATVPSEVQQQSANFTYSDVEQGRTIFTLRASHATQFKKENRAVLDDVWITVYGRAGDRNDNIHTRQCSYEPNTGGVLCQGEVQIDLQAAPNASAKGAASNSAPGKGAPMNDAPGNSAAGAMSQPMQVKTSNLLFNRQTGEASTDSPVEFTFAQGHGRGNGIRYSTHDSTLRVEHDVAFYLNASDHSGGLPVNATGSAMEVQRDSRTAVLSGPATIRQGTRELTAGTISVSFDKDFHPQEAVAQQNPLVRDTENGSKFTLAAEKLTATLDTQGSVSKLTSEGKVIGTRETPAGSDHLSANRLDFDMDPGPGGHNAVRDVLASGNVAAESHQASNSRVLKTESLKISFRMPEAASQQKPGKSPSNSPFDTGNQQIQDAETLAPATIETKSGNEFTRLSAKRFVAEFDSAGRLEKLLGHDGIEVRRQIDKSTPQTSTSAELVATFASTGEWASIDETGDVRFSDADRRASASHATMLRSTGLATLEGSPVVSDAQSRTTASSVSINQQSGEIHAVGGVVSTYFPGTASTPGSTSGSKYSTTTPSAANAGPNLGSGPAHIASDRLDGSSTSGHVTYSGHARLWQGQSVLEAERIEIWRDDRKMQAEGHVVAVFPQAPGTGPSFASMSPTQTNAHPYASAASSAPHTTLWQLKAPSLTYLSDQGKAHLEGGVTATSDQGSLESRTLDAFLSPASATTPAPASPNPVAPFRELSRILAQGSVVARQGERQGSAERGEYTASDQKFVLSGGEPAIHDASSDTTTTGRSLTFYVASDTILIDSQEGLRTLTKHRVEK